MDNLSQFHWWEKEALHGELLSAMATLGTGAHDDYRLEALRRLDRPTLLDGA